MGGHEVLACYGQLAVAVGKMVELARTREWARLPELDALCTDLVMQLRHLEPVAAFSDSECHRLEQLANRIEEDQVALNDLVRPHFLQLMRRMAARPADR